MKIKVLLSLVFAAVSSLSAGTLNYITEDPAKGKYVDFSLNGTEREIYAGAYLGTYNGGPLLTFFCADPFLGINYGVYDSQAWIPSGYETRAAWLYGNQIGSIDTQNEGAAMQLAIWDILFDGGDGASMGIISGASTTDANVLGLWSSYLSISNGQSSNTVASIYRNSLNGFEAQPFIGPGDPNAIPEPSTYALIGTGLVAAFFARRKK
jgi:hypothetical protein